MSSVGALAPDRGDTRGDKAVVRDGSEMFVERVGAGASYATSPPLMTTGASILVNSTSDVASHDGQCTLREAITAANTDTASGMQMGECVAGAGDDTISFAPNVAGTINLTGVLPDIDSNVNIAGPGSSMLTVRRDTGGDYRIFMIKSGNTVSISGMTITNGFVLGADGIERGEDAFGGGIFNAGTLTMSDCTVDSNKVQGGSASGLPGGSSLVIYTSVGGIGGGGGIYNAGAMTLLGSRVRDNVALFGVAQSGECVGGGIYNHGTMTILGSDVSGNNIRFVVTAIERPIIFKGEGIYNDGTLDLIRTEMHFNGGSLAYAGPRIKGAGISSSSGVTTLTDCVISSNRAIVAVYTALSTLPFNPEAANQTGQGGGIYLFSGELILRNTVVFDNRVRGSSIEDPGHGAGIFVESGTLNLTNSVVSRNLAINAGCLTLDNCGRPEGAGIYLKSGNVTLSSSTINGNFAFNLSGIDPTRAKGGGVYIAGGTFRLKNTIISGNDALEQTVEINSVLQSDLDNIVGEGDDVYGNVTSKGHNLIRKISESTGWISSDMLGLDAQLALPYTPAPGSPAIDAGDNTGAPEKDLRGMIRLSQDNSVVDIGAIEAVPYVPALLSIPGNIVVEATGAGGATVNYSTSASNDPPDKTRELCSAPSGSVFSVGLTTVYCYAVDNRNYTYRGSFGVKVQDTTAPIISGIPANITVEATGPDGAVVKWPAPTALDIVDGPLEVDCNGLGIGRDGVPQDNNPVNFIRVTSGSIFPLDYLRAPVFVQCTATDAHGNSSFSGFDVRIVDTTPPVLTLPGDVTVEGTRASGAKATWTPPTATDIVKGSLQVNCSHASGDAFPLGETVVQCSATDGWNNTAQGSFKVTVLPSQTPPALDLPADITAEALDSSGAIVSYSASAKDIAGVTVAINCVMPSGSTFPLGPTTVFCSATDSNDNTANGTFKVTVLDTTAPVISNLPGNITVEATSPSGGVASWASPVATDLVDKVVAVNCSTASGSIFPPGSTTVTCSATDAHNNRASGSFNVTVLPVPSLSITSDGTFTYNGQPHPVSVSVTGIHDEDLLPQGMLSITYTDANGQTSANAPKDVGTYGVNISFTSGVPSYSNASNNQKTITITKAPLYVDTDRVVKTYGDPLPAFTPAYSGFVNGEGPSVLGGTLGFDTNVTETTPFGVYTVTTKGLTSNNYQLIFNGGIVIVGKALLTVTAANAARIYGAANPSFSGTLDGIKNGDRISVSYACAANATSPVGTYSIVPTLADPDGKLDNYEVVSSNGTLTVDKANPTIAWTTPAQIVYGTPLSVTQLNATASVAGTFTYTPAPGTILNAGDNQTLSVIFTPADSVNYNAAEASVNIRVAKATPVVSWSDPADISAGTALSAAQLNASASFNNQNVPGIFIYTPPAGFVLDVGTQQILSVSFAPTDSLNFNIAAASVKINVVTIEQAAGNIVTSLVNFNLVPVKSSAALTDVLVKAVTKANKKDEGAEALNQLEAYKNMVRAAVQSGRLPAVQGQALIDSINNFAALIKP